MNIGVAGMIGSGKTTLTSALAARFGLQLALESVDGDNPWLDAFYSGPEGMRTYGLHLQLHFLATRFASMPECAASARCTSSLLTPTRRPPPTSLDNRKRPCGSSSRQ